MNFRKAEQIRLVIADDHPIFRDGLRRLLEAEPDHKVIGEASDGAEAVKLARQLKPDILLLDLAMPKPDRRSASAGGPGCGAQGFGHSSSTEGHTNGDCR